MLNLPGPNIFSKIKLSNTLAERLDVGFGRHGPTLRLSGTLTTSLPVIFVQDISMDVIRRRTRECHRFEWFGLLPPRLSSQEVTESALQMPTKFMITSSQPYLYNILFVNQEQYGRLKPIFKALRYAWEPRIQNRVPPPAETSLQDMFRDFIKDPSVAQLADKLQGLSFWEDGEYILRLQIKTPQPRRSLEIRKNFVLSTADAQCLRSNAPAIIADLCSQPGISYNIASPGLT